MRAFFKSYACALCLLILLLLQFGLEKQLNVESEREHRSVRLISGFEIFYEIQRMNDVLFTLQLGIITVW